MTEDAVVKIKHFLEMANIRFAFKFPHLIPFAACIALRAYAPHPHGIRLNWQMDYRDFTAMVTSQLLAMALSGESCEKHCLSLCHWQLSRRTRRRVLSGLWAEVREEAISTQCDGPFSHWGTPSANEVADPTSTATVFTETLPRWETPLSNQTE